MEDEKMQEIDDEIKDLQEQHLELMKKLQRYHEGSKNYNQTIAESNQIENEIERKKK